MDTIWSSIVLDWRSSVERLLQSGSVRAFNAEESKSRCRFSEWPSGRVESDGERPDGIAVRYVLTRLLNRRKTPAE